MVVPPSLIDGTTVGPLTARRLNTPGGLLGALPSWQYSRSRSGGGSRAVGRSRRPVARGARPVAVARRRAVIRPAPPGSLHPDRRSHWPGRRPPPARPDRRGEGREGGSERSDRRSRVRCPRPLGVRHRRIELVRTRLRADRADPGPAGNVARRHFPPERLPAVSGVPGVPRSSEPTPDERAGSTSLGDLLGEVSRDLSTLIRQEMALAKAELKESAGKAGKGAGLLGGAGYAALMAVLFLSIALWWSLGTLIGNGWSGVVVAVIWGVVAAILFAVGRRSLKQVDGVPETVDTLKKIPDTLKPNGARR
ncbi:hypothetical protein GSU10_00840 [Rathayibacter tanaceti]|uniref:Superfamily III holin-X n=1 Tax=Rathayibacter tanaceti TaxID=1671680 RepID=A0AAE6V6I0_9MICO|nr:hypothetical protein GSU10_00840 [Rathayibacter tanaceti]